MATTCLPFAAAPKVEASLRFCLCKCYRLWTKLEFSTKLTESHPSLSSLMDGSRFDLLFLQYINTAATKWNICIWVPYCTSFWQVGDSPEQNGSFKLALTKCKRDLLTQKERRHAAFAVEKDGIVDLAWSKAWDESFAQINTNQNAVAEQGWVH